MEKNYLLLSNIHSMPLLSLSRLFQVPTYPLILPLCPLFAFYRLPYASILETPVLLQAVDLLWVWCPLFFGDCIAPAYKCSPPSLGLKGTIIPADWVILQVFLCLFDVGKLAGVQNTGERYCLAKWKPSWSSFCQRVAQRTDGNWKRWKSCPIVYASSSRLLRPILRRILSPDRKDIHPSKSGKSLFTWRTIYLLCGADSIQKVLSSDILKVKKNVI